MSRINVTPLRAQTTLQKLVGVATKIRKATLARYRLLENRPQHEIRLLENGEKRLLE